MDDAKTGGGVKDRLEACLAINRAIRCKRRQIEELEKLRKYGFQAETEQQIARSIYDCGHEVARLMAERDRLSALVSKIPLDQRAVLEARYISGMKWEAVSELTHYSLVHVYRLAKKGVQSMECACEAAF